MAGELIASVMENIDLNCLLSNPQRITLPDCPAPCSGPLENSYYLSVTDIVDKVNSLVV